MVVVAVVVAGGMNSSRAAAASAGEAGRMGEARKVLLAHAATGAGRLAAGDAAIPSNPFSSVAVLIGNVYRFAFAAVYPAVGVAAARSFAWYTPADRFFSVSLIRYDSDALKC